MSRLRCFTRTTVLGLFLLALIVAAPAAQALVDAETHRYDDSWGAEGLTMTRSGGDVIELNFSIGQWTMGQMDVNGRAVNTVKMPGVLLPNNAGSPDLPGMSRYIALPGGATASVRVIDSRREVYFGVDLAPAPVIPLENDDRPLDFTRNLDIYNKDVMYPASPAVTEGIGTIRGVNAAMLGITPFQYNPVSQELVVHRDIRLEVKIEGGNGQYGETRLRSRWFDPILNDIFVNASSLPAVAYPVPSGNRTPDHEYVIICPPVGSYVAWADSLRLHRNEQGIRTGVYTTADIGGNTIAAIEGFIDDAYTNWDVPPVAVLLIGDYGSEATDIVSPIYNSYCVSDHIYADVNENTMADLILARMTAENPTQLETMVRKVLDYEWSPPTNPDFYAKPVLTGGWQTERWFVLCSEVLHGFLENELGKTPIREYANYNGWPSNVWSTATNTAAVTSYFGSGGLGYLPNSPSHLEMGANATRLNNDINAGTFIVQHRDHGGETGWGEPDYQNSDLAGLNNEDLTFVFSINCLTGKFNYGSECFAEAFHRHGQGALGLIAASEVSYSFVNDTYIWGMYDYMWPDFLPDLGVPGDHKLLPAFANVSGKYFLQGSSWPYNTSNKEVTYYLFHHHGDAFQTVYSEVPSLLDVAHDGSLISGVDFFSVAAEAGALIGLSVNGEVIGSALSNGGLTTVPIPSQIPGQDLVVTVTKQNRYRYRRVVPIVPPEGSFVVFSDVVLNDANGNGQLDFTEMAYLSLTLQNVGLESSVGTSAVISTEDEYVTILDDTEVYGDIAGDGSLTVTDGYQIQLSADVPDGHIMQFRVAATDADSTYTSRFSLMGHAPVVELSTVVITGDDDDDGILDPGETAVMEVTLANTGSSDVFNMNLELASLNENVTLGAEMPVLSVIPADGSATASWTVGAADEAQIGETADFSITASGDDYDFAGAFAISLGLSIEGFESGDFTSYPWELSGGADWFITDIAAHEGTYCARSGAIGDNEESNLLVETDVMTDGTISFYLKVSSESSYDHLQFFIDDTLKGEWDGELGWTEVSFPVDAGARVFRWTYIKDSSVSNGSDCAWIDDIIFPAIGAPLYPSCEVTPETIDVTLSKPNNTMRLVTMTNTGEGELDYEASVSLEMPRQSQVPFQNFKKDEVDTRVDVSDERATGGPDAFGYTWIDSDEEGGPVYDWVEINQVGTLAGTGDDTNFGPFELGFDFPYYGGTFNFIRICTNGWASFTSTDTDYSNQAIPTDDEPNNLLAVFWDDMRNTYSGDILYYQDLNNGRFIVEFDDVPHYSGGTNETFQVIINDDGTILYQYKSVGTSSNCTVGTENATGDDGLQILFNQADYLHDEMAILIAPEPLPEPWLSVSPRQGTVGAMSSGDLEVTFNSIDVPVGTYRGTVNLQTNDPENLSMQIPVTLTVTDGVSGMEDQGLPSVFALEGAYPNPFNPATNIKFATPRDGYVTLKIYDLAGRHVRTLVDEQKDAGFHSIMWDGTDHGGRGVASGAYYYRLKADGFDQTQKMLLLK